MVDKVINSCNVTTPGRGGSSFQYLFCRLMLDISNRHITAYVDHNNGTKVVEASTKEFPIARHLYKTSDVAAAFNIGRVIAARCKEAGLRRVMWEHKWNRNHKKVRTTAPPLKKRGNCSLSTHLPLPSKIVQRLVRILFSGGKLPPPPPKSSSFPL